MKTTSFKHAKCTILQKQIRRFLEQLKATKALSATIILQRVARGMIVRVHNEVKSFASIEIQRVWRGYRANVEYMLIILACVRIQSFARCVLNRSKLQLQKGLQSVNAENMEQTQYFDHNSRYDISNQPPSRIELLERLSFSTHYTEKIEVRLSNTSKKQSHQTIGDASSKLVRRTSDALRVVTHSPFLSEVMRAIAVLEASTQNSFDCCKIFASKNAQHVLFSLIRSCNRSSPHLELIRLTLSTLMNISKHPSVVSCLATYEAVDVLTYVIQLFRDKANLFALSSSLLETIFLCSDNLIVSCFAMHLFCLKSIELSKSSHFFVFSKEKYLTQEHKKCLSGILLLNKKRASMIAQPLSTSSEAYKYLRGIRSLESILFEINKSYYYKGEA